MFKHKITWEYILFYLLFFGTVIAIFFSHPFMKYPFDMYIHFQKIDGFYNKPQIIPSSGRYYWYYVWAKFFSLFQIDNTQIFLRANIIHYIQTVITYFSIYVGSKLIIRNVFYGIKPIFVNYLAYWATIIWFTIFATASVGQHLIWIEWYSINYQITLPLTILMLGLLFYLLFEEHSQRERIRVLFLFLICMVIVLTIHNAEFVYFLLYLFLLSFIFLDNIIRFAKKHYTVTLGTLSILGVLLYNIQVVVHFVADRTPPILNYLDFDKIDIFLTKLKSDGAFIVAKLSRSWACYNELFTVSLTLITITFIFIIYQKYIRRTQSCKVNIRLFFFIVLASLFIFIPMNKYSAGLASMITYKFVVHRFYFGSLIFLAMPISLYCFVSMFQLKNKIVWINLAIVLTLLGTFYYSKYDI